jgi:hypothetical protein
MTDLINEWLAARADWATANAAGRPAQVCNRIMDRTWALSSEIAGHPELHEAIIALCEPGQDSDVRLGAGSSAWVQQRPALARVGQRDPTSSGGAIAAAIS